jgi:flagellar FliL protein
MMKNNHAGQKEGAGEHGEAKAEQAVAPPPPPVPSLLPGPTIRLPDFVIRLRNPEQDRFARISFEVEVTEEIDKDKIVKRQARIRDNFIRFLSDRTVEELRGSEGLERVKSELQEMLIEIAPDGRIRGLYITDFVVQ